MIFRKAKKQDLSEIIKMLASYILGSKREDYTYPLPDEYLTAFENISNDSNQHLMVVEDNGEVIGTFQLSYIQYLTYRGGIRAQIEAVRIREDKRGLGLGEKMFNWAIARAKEDGAHLIQLTTDKKRPEALRFYEKLGFKASHEGMKLHYEV